MAIPEYDQIFDPMKHSARTVMGYVDVGEEIIRAIQHEHQELPLQQVKPENVGSGKNSQPPINGSPKAA